MSDIKEKFIVLSKTFKIFTFGCKTNLEESDYMAQELKSVGFIEKNKTDNTDFTIYNSCSVTSNADNEILYSIRKQKKTEPDTKIILTGCLAQADWENLLNNPDISLILGNSEKLKIKDYISNENIKCEVQSLMNKKDFDEFNLHFSKRTRATLKIQDGCNNFCSYCIVPFTRGKSRSSHLENVLNNVRDYINNGYKEIVFSGIHLGLWGLDFPDKMKLVDLLREIEKLDNMPRYRLGSLDPKELDDELIDFIINSEKICNHLHVSLQSACNKTLKNMNRHYSVEDTINKLDYINKSIKNINIGADVIAGFPDETDEDFQITYENISGMPIKYMHVFPYSQRQYTKAALMPNQIDERVKLERAKKLRDLAAKKQNEFLKSMLNIEHAVLIEKNKNNSNLYNGVSSNYIKFVVESDKNISQNIVMLKGMEIKNKKIFAKVNI